MRVLSVCSGAGGMDLGFHRAGCRTVGLCEWDEWLRTELLPARFPGVPVHHDLEELADWAERDPDAVREWLGGQPDLLIGGTPCQDLSHAGKRAGLEGERSGLYWAFQRLRIALGIKWAIWENVEGALSSNGGMDFACVLGAFVGADVALPARGWSGAGVATGPWGGCVYRVLDAQHFGVPQRRRRVFVAGHLGGECPPEVLLESTSGQGHPASRTSARTRTASSAQGGAARAGLEPTHAPIAGTVGGGAHGAGRRTPDDDNYVVNALVKRYAKGTDSDATDAFVVGTLPARGKTGGFDVDPAMAADGHLVTAATLTSGRGRPGVSAAGRRQEDDVNLVAFNLRGREGGAQAEPTDLASVRAASGGSSRSYVAHALTSAGFDASEDGTGRGTPLVSDGVRAADGLAGPLDGSVSGFDPQPDGRRYAACGNGVVAPVAEWIGRRLRAVAEVEQEARRAA